MSKSLYPLLAKKAPVVSKLVGRKSLVFKKNAPHIFFVGGLVGSVASTVMACRATLALEETIDEIKIDLDAAKEIQSDLENGTASGHAGQDLAYIYLKSAGKVVRLYGPALAVGVVSVGALTGSHIDLSRRNTALMAAYTGLQAAYESYRERVIAELGGDREKDLYHAKVDEVQAAGSSDVTPLVDRAKGAVYSRLFDEASTRWEKDPEYNRMFLQVQQNYFNDLLQARGHVFLNEVYDNLGFERTPEASVVGWLVGPRADGLADGYIDFGFYEAVDFINGREPRVLLDFNVDGVIYNKI